MKTRNLCVLVMSLAFTILFVTGASATTFAVGDVFVSVGNGKVIAFTPTGTYIQTLDNGTGAEYLTGSAFDSGSNFYVTNISATTISKFDSSGALATQTWAVGTGSPESIVPVASGPYAGTFFVGELFQTGTILQYNSSGVLIHTYIVGATNVSQNGGANWIDFQDANTIIYDGGGYDIRSFNITTNTQNANFATPGGINNGLRVIPRGLFAGDVLVAENTHAELFSFTGVPLQTYTLPGNSGNVFALNLDPNGTDFWVSDAGNGKVWAVNILTGSIGQQWLSTGYGPHSGLGLSVFGPTTPDLATEKGEVTLFYAQGKIKNQDLTQSLLDKLGAAAQARGAGDCKTANNIYAAFINQLNAQSGKGVDATAAQILITDAQFLMAHCP